MQTIRDWVKFYKGKRLWVYPCNLEEKQWLYWKNLKSKEEYVQASKNWDWDSSTGIRLVVGKGGARVIEVTNKQLVKKALHLLNLPEDYPWIIYSQSKYGIVVDTPGVSKRTNGMTNKSFKHVLLFWDGYYVLPSVGIARYFYKNQIPQGHPTQVSDDVFIGCFENLII